MSYYYYITKLYYYHCHYYDDDFIKGSCPQDMLCHLGLLNQPSSEFLAVRSHELSDTDVH